MLISRKPIVPEYTESYDEEMLTQDVLPEGLLFEHLHLFEATCNHSKAINSILLGNVQEVVMREKIKAENFYRFIVNNQTMRSD